MIAWALVEMPALITGVFLYLVGNAQILSADTPVFAVGTALTFPRAWLVRNEGRARGPGCVDALFIVVQLTLGSRRVVNDIGSFRLFVGVAAVVF
jgi:hypothetical protein